MITNIGRIETRILRDAMHIASRFSDRARMQMDATALHIKAKNVYNTAAVWIDIPKKYITHYDPKDALFTDEIGINTEKMYRMLNAYEANEQIYLALEHRVNVGELITISGNEGTLWTYQTSLDHIDRIPEYTAIRSAHPLPASGDKDAEIFRDWLQSIECEDGTLTVSFIHDKEHERYTIWAVSEVSGNRCATGNPEVPNNSNNFRTCIAFDLLQRVIAPECIDDMIKFSFGDDTTLLMDTQVNGCDVAMAIAPRIED